MGPSETEDCSSKIKYGARKRNRNKETTEELDTGQEVEADTTEDKVCCCCC